MGDRVSQSLAVKLKPRPSIAIVAVCFALGGWAYWKSGDVRIGDTQAGVPELRPDSRYNRDTQVITSKFTIGVDILSVIVETVPNGCVDYEVVTLMDRFEGHIRQVPGVQSVISLPAMAKI
ncbi:MAG: RND family transporter, partial [Verrucomicrobiota bacterium]